MKTRNNNKLFLIVRAGDPRNDFWTSSMRREAALQRSNVSRSSLHSKQPPMEPILFYTESPAFRAVARCTISEAARNVFARKMRLRDEAEGNESETRGMVAAGIKHKMVYIR